MIRRRLLIALIVGAFVAGAATFWPLLTEPLPHILLGFIAAGITFSVPLLTYVLRHDAQTTQKHVAGRDGDRAWYDVVVLAVGIASLAAVTVLLVGGQQKGAAAVANAAIGLFSVAVGWLSVHTMYTLRYARFYYSQPEAPIDFNNAEPPRFSDFAYLSFTLGMTYQVSDTNIHSGELRRIVLGHTLISYLFGTVVIAASINLLVGFGPLLPT